MEKTMNVKSILISSTVRINQCIMQQHEYVSEIGNLSKETNSMNQIFPWN